MNVPIEIVIIGQQQIDLTRLKMELADMQAKLAAAAPTKPSKKGKSHVVAV